MSKVSRRVVLTGLAASMLVRPSFAAPTVPTKMGEIDIAQAKAEGQLTLYTSLDTSVVDAILKNFKDKYGIAVQYFRTGNASVAGKILAEADAGHVQADIVDNTDISSLFALKDRGLLRPYVSEAAAAVPASLQDPDHCWIADRLTLSVIQYNTKEFGKAPPQSWKDMTDPRMKGRACYVGNSNGDSDPRYYALAQAFGWDLLKAFAANQPLRMSTPQIATQTVESDERGAAFATNNNVAFLSKKQGKPTDFVFPKEGVPVDPAAVGLLKGSAKPHASALLLEYWMSAEGQALVTKGGKYSSRADVAPPTGNPSLDDLKLLEIDFKQYAQDKQDILQHLTDTFGGDWGL